MLKKMQYSQNLDYKHEIITKNNGSNLNLNNNGVIFIEEGDNPGENCFTSKNEDKNKRTYWFQKYLQDLQNRGISRKIVKHF